MKKKIVSLAVSTCLAIPCVLGLTACSNVEKCNWASTWTTSETHHWHVCLDEDCNKANDIAEHVWDEGKITTQATPTQDGVKTFTCEVCEFTKTEPVEYVIRTTVTEEEWNSAYNLSSHGHYTINIFTNNELTETEQFDGKNMLNLNHSENSSYYDSFYIKDDLNYYLYIGKYIDGVWNTHISENLTEDAYNFHISWYEKYLQSELEVCKYTEFSYNTTTKAYENIIENAHVSFSFEEGLLKSIVVSDSESQYKYSIDYSEVNLTLPPEFVESTINEEEWDTIMTSIPNCDVTQTRINESSITILKYDYPNVYYLSMPGQAERYFVKDGNNYYKYINIDVDEWEKSTITEEEYMTFLDQLTFGFQYKDFRYDAITGKYNGEIASSNIMITFKNGLLMEITYLNTGISFTFDYTQLDLTFPEI